MADLFKSKMVRIQGADQFMKILSTGVFSKASSELTLKVKSGE